MCTCLTFQNEDFYFGRNLDLEVPFGREIVVTPRNFRFSFKYAGSLSSHYALIGMAERMNDYPLYAEAVNEKGLGMAGLNFPGNAVYREKTAEKDNVASFELIPWLLSTCSNIKEARKQLERICITDDAFTSTLPPAPLHFMLADKKECLVIESVKDGLKIYDNPVGVLTNNPPFPFHLDYLAQFLNLSAAYSENRFSQKLCLEPFGQGMGSFGLPGDLSPASRFVRAAFLKWNSCADKDEASSVSQFFHILDGVKMIKGAALNPQGRSEVTTYSCCINTDKGIYYVKSYENSQIQKVELHHAPLDSNVLIAYPVNRKESFDAVN